jgi:guanylate kinase
MTGGGDPFWVFIISGPSGCGKSTLVEKLLTLPRMRLSISVTTRTPRPGEQEGEWYRFVDGRTFEQLRDRGEFIEWARVFGSFYGTPKSELEAARAAGEDLVLEIDVQGAEQVKEKIGPTAIAVFIAPPSRQVLEERLRGRGKDSDAAIARRLETAREEMGRWREYDYIVINDDLERAAAEVVAIANAVRRGEGLEAATLPRNAKRVEEILETFGG